MMPRVRQKAPISSDMCPRSGSQASSFGGPAHVSHARSKASEISRALLDPRALMIKGQATNSLEAQHMIPSMWYGVSSESVTANSSIMTR